MTLTRRAALTATAAALATPALLRRSWAQAPAVLRLHQFMTTQATLPRDLFRPWAEDVSAATDGTVTFEHYDSMTLGGKPGDLIDQARDGVADIVVTLTGYTPGRFPRSEVFELPFVMTDPVATGRAYNRLIEEDFQHAEFHGVKILAGWVHGPGVIHSRQPITRLEDMAGRQLRGPTRPVTALLAELGATPVGMPLPAIPEALSKGVVDGAVVPWEITPSIRLSELVHDHTEFHSTEALYTATFVMAMHPASFAALTPEQQAAIEALSGDVLAERATRVQIAGDAPARQAALDAGNRLHVLDQAEVERWKARAEPVHARWVAELEDQGIAAAALLARTRDLIAGLQG